MYFFHLRQCLLNEYLFLYLLLELFLSKDSMFNQLRLSFKNLISKAVQLFIYKTLQLFSIFMRARIFKVLVSRRTQLSARLNSPSESRSRANSDRSSANRRDCTGDGLLETKMLKQDFESDFGNINLKIKNAIILCIF